MTSECLKIELLVNLRPGSGVLSEVMRVAGGVLPCYGSVDLSGKFVNAAIVYFGEIKYSV